MRTGNDSRNLLVLGAALSCSLLHGQTSVLTYHNDNLRTGWNSSEKTLTPATVGGGRFGLLAKVTLDGQVDAQPLFVSGQLIKGQGVHDVVYVATSANSVWALDAKSGAVLKKVVLGTPVPQSALPSNCGNNGPTVGITSTPVIDLTLGAIYVVAYILLPNQTPQYQLHALDLTTLQERTASPVVVSAVQTLSNGMTFTFNARFQRQRPALLESNGKIYVGFGSFCDLAQDKSRGWLLSWDARTLLTQGVGVLPNREVYSGAGQPGNIPTYLSSIWMSGFGPAADKAGDIYFVTSNSQPGTFDSMFNLAESAVRLSGDLSRVVGFFTPNTIAVLDQADQDFGAGGLMVLPDQRLGNGQFPHLAVAAGKDGYMFLLNRDNLGRLQTPNSPNASNIGPCWCGPSYFETESGPRIVSSGGTALAEWFPTVFKNNTPGLWQLAVSPSAVESPKSSPGSDVGHDFGFFTSVSSNGATAGSVLIWAIGRNYGTGSVPLTLRAFTEPKSGLGNVPPPAMVPVWSGVACSWSSPNANPNLVATIANGRVYVASDRQVTIFGLR